MIITPMLITDIQGWLKAEALFERNLSSLTIVMYNTNDYLSGFDFSLQNYCIFGEEILRVCLAGLRLLAFLMELKSIWKTFGKTASPVELGL
jgi:hypothetical protein